MRELCTLYPYGLNDKLHSVGNLSQLDKDAVIWRFFNSHHRKRRPISGQKRHHRRKQRSRYTNIRQCIDEVLNLYPCNDIIHRLKSFVCGLPKCILRDVLETTKTILADDALPKFVLLSLMDLVRHRLEPPLRKSSPEGPKPKQKFLQGSIPQQWHRTGEPGQDLP